MNETQSNTLSHMRGMPTAVALNLCDVLDPAFMNSASASCPPSHMLSQLCEHACWQSGAAQVSRLYMGSYFCERYFLACGTCLFDAVADYACEWGLPVTLVLPVFGQGALQAGTAMVARLLDKHANPNGPVDEVCVNDCGMAAWFAGTDSPAPQASLAWGRLFNRSTRDPRYAAFGNEPYPLGIDVHEARRIAETFGVCMVEVDPVTPKIDLSPLQGVLPVALHLPHCFVSTGRICLFAAQHKPASQKFRPGAACSLECQQVINVYETFDGDRATAPSAQQGYQPTATVFTRHGRTVYFENPGCSPVGGSMERVVWTPNDFCCPSALPASVDLPYASWLGHPSTSGAGPAVYPKTDGGSDGGGQPWA